MGSSYSFRLVKGIAEKEKKVCLLNVGASRGDPLASPDLRLDIECTPVLIEAAKQIAKSLGKENDAEFKRLVSSGIIKAVDTQGKYPASS